jgi:hypothetical protein
VVDSGAELTLHGEVSCVPECDLRGRSLLIKDQAGADVGALELTKFDGKTNETGDFVVKAPVQAGEYTWSAVCPAVVMEGISYPEAHAQISFSVKPHAASVVIWDIPSALVIGERFRTKVGIKCSSECCLTDTDIGIYDHEGTRIATGVLSGDRWPGTTGLYFTEIELETPAAVGLYTWSVRTPASNVGIPHDEGSVSFGVRVVSQPEFVVRVETVDKVSQSPISGARVVMHPYRTVTDERGLAEVRVAKGAYRLFVTQTNYLMFALPVEVATDITARAELELEPVAERN